MITRKERGLTSYTESADAREGNLDATGLAQWFTAKVILCPRDPWQCLETLLGSQLERRFSRYLVGGAKEAAHHSVVHGAAHTAKPPNE